MQRKGVEAGKNIGVLLSIVEKEKKLRSIAKGLQEHAL